MNLKISRDRNGNKTIKVSNLGVRGFSIQTLGNLPRTHKMFNEDLNKEVAETEIYDYVQEYGTQRQKDALNIY